MKRLKVATTSFVVLKVKRTLIFSAVVFLVLVQGGRVGANKLKSVKPSEVLKRADKKIENGAGVFRYRYDSSHSGNNSGEDRSLAPYFYLPGGSSDVDTLPLKETSADVKIAGVIASVKIRQVFENSGKKPIEAVYVFPASTRAAVHGMRMRIGERTIEAKIDQREEARQSYEQAKQEGKRASLLEQQRPNVFTMNVANIMPGDKINVELDYSELLVPEDATYEFVYPTVVGPRYGGGADPDRDNWISNPYLHQRQKEPYKFDIKVSLETGIPIKEIASPSHKIKVSYKSSSSAEVRLDQTGGGNKDFVLRYRLAGNKIESGAIVYRGKDENFFTVIVEPPQRPKPSQIPAREYIFVLDVSGSMRGFPLDTAKKLMRKLFRSMRSNDYFNLVLFAGSSYRWKGVSQPVTKENIDEVVSIIERQAGGGGTELIKGLKNAYSISQPREKGIARTVVVVTDGYVGVEAKAFKFIRDNLSEANLFAFGIGTSVNRALIEGMARAGMGEPFVVLDPSRADVEAEKFRKYIEAPVLTDIEVEFSKFKAEELYPQQIPDLLAKRPIVVIGKFRGRPSGEVVIRGISGDGKYVKRVSISSGSSGERTKALRWLWARRWVELLEDERALLPDDNELKEAVTSLGLRYSLLTSETSFVAIDSEAINNSSSPVRVKQPLPLPEGVSNYAVGGGGGGGSFAALPGKMPRRKFKKPALAGKETLVDKPVFQQSVAGEAKGKGNLHISLSFKTIPPNATIHLWKKKKIEYLIRKVIEKKLLSMKSGEVYTFIIRISVAPHGRVKDVTITGQNKGGVFDGIASEIKKWRIFRKISLVEVMVSVKVK